MFWSEHFTSWILYWQKLLNIQIAEMLAFKITQKNSYIITFSFKLLQATVSIAFILFPKTYSNCISKTGWRAKKWDKTFDTICEIRSLV